MSLLAAVSLASNATTTTPTSPVSGLSWNAIMLIGIGALVLLVLTWMLTRPRK